MVNAPIHKAKAGAMSVAIWENVSEKDGAERIYCSVTFERVYKDDKVNWQNMKVQLDERDLGMAIALLQNAQHVLIKSLALSRPSPRPNPWKTFGNKPNRSAKLPWRSAAPATRCREWHMR